MRLRNSKTAYGAVARTLHWTIAALIVAAIPLGLWAASIGPRNPDPAQALLRDELLLWHKSLGLSVLLLAGLRVAWLFASPRPPLPITMPALERGLAKSVHWLLYGLIFAMPVSGIILSQSAGFPATFFGLRSVPVIFPADLTVPPLQRPGVQLGLLLHEGVVLYALAGALTLHLLGVAKHVLFDRDRTIWRRMGGRPQVEEPDQAARSSNVTASGNETGGEQVHLSSPVQGAD